ncbi:hypothetical protein HQ520_14815 [bacterium]|nr:hypothetical protein [bacterium]
MRPYADFLAQYDSFLKRVEQFIDVHLQQLEGKPEISPPPPDLKILNTLVTLIKRMQDAQRALYLDARKIQGETTDEIRSTAMHDDRISAKGVSP